jgi:hypothetical protein
VTTQESNNIKANANNKFKKPNAWMLCIKMDETISTLLIHDKNMFFEIEVKNLCKYLCILCQNSFDQIKIDYLNPNAESIKVSQMLRNIKFNNIH